MTQFHSQESSVKPIQRRTGTLSFHCLLLPPSLFILCVQTLQTLKLDLQPRKQSRDILAFRYITMSKHHPDLVMCRKQPGIAIGRLCEKCTFRFLTYDHNYSIFATVNLYVFYCVLIWIFLRYCTANR
jgi:hypothetical protein